MKRAFTLIELLVVVLSIGILSAVALPQYQKAVDKTRMAQLMTLGAAVKTAQEEYYLANGEYTQNWDNLSLSFEGSVSGPTLTNSQGWELVLVKYNGSQPSSVYIYDSRLPEVLLIVAYAHADLDGTGWDNARVCYATATNTRANNVCKAVSGKSVGSATGDYNTYRF